MYLFLIFSLFFISSSLFASALSDSVLFALSNNEKVKEQQHVIKGTEYSLKVAQSDNRPQILGSFVVGQEFYESPSQSGQDHTVYTGHLHAEQKIFDFGHVHHSIGIWRERGSAEIANLSVIRNRVYVEAMRAYLDVARVKQLISVYDRYIEKLKAFSDLIQQGVKVGKYSDYDDYKIKAWLDLVQEHRMVLDEDLLRVYDIYHRVLGQSDLPVADFNLESAYSFLGTYWQNYSHLVMTPQAIPSVVRDTHVAQSHVHEARSALSSSLPQVKLVADGFRLHNKSGIVGDQDTVMAGVETDVTFYDGGKSKSLYYAALEHASEFYEKAKFQNFLVDSTWKFFPQEIASVLKVYLNLKLGVAASEKYMSVSEEQLKLGLRSVSNVLPSLKQYYQSEELLLTHAYDNLIKIYDDMAILDILPDPKTL